jgi:ribosomal protein L19
LTTQSSSDQCAQPIPGFTPGDKVSGFLKIGYLPIVIQGKVSNVFPISTIEGIVVDTDEHGNALSIEIKRVEQQDASTLRGQQINLTDPSIEEYEINSAT